MPRLSGKKHCKYDDSGFATLIFFWNIKVYLKLNVED